MKTMRMKGKNVEEATNAAIAVLGIEKEKAIIKVINEGKAAILGIIGGEEAEVEVAAKEAMPEEARQVLQNILDKMGFLAVVDAGEEEGERINLDVKGEDMGRIIGKEGAMLKSLELIVGIILWKMSGEKVRVSVDAGGYKEKREKALERLADEIAEEVEKTGQEKTLPRMEASDRRIIHLHLSKNDKVTTYSTGEGQDRRMTVAPKK
jgi:spoIIIJ-associated protein